MASPTLKKSKIPEVKRPRLSCTLPPKSVFFKNFFFFVLIKVVCGVGFRLVVEGFDFDLV